MTKSKRGKPSAVTPPLSPSLPDDDSSENLKEYMKENFEQMKEKLAEVTENMATNENVNNLLKLINEQKQKIEKMEDKIAVMESHIAHLSKLQENADQYQRRLCLRINGVDLPDGEVKETANECLGKVKQVFNELNVDIPDEVIDRAHRIGKSVMWNGKKAQQMIVRFTTWRHRTIVYQARKNSNKYRIKMDLTKERVGLLRRANEVLNSNQNSFAFCNYNCQPCWFNNGRYIYFNDLNELENSMSRG